MKNMFYLVLIFHPEREKEGGEGGGENKCMITVEKTRNIDK